LTRSKNEVVKVWIAAGLWLAIIITESSKIGGSNNTSRVFFPIFHFLFGMDSAHFSPWHFLIRKTGHVVGYFIMSLLFFRAWRATLPRSITAWALHWAAIAWILTTFVASMDEWHQEYVPGRGSSFQDVLLDSSAALAAQVIIWYWSRNRRKPDSTPEARALDSVE
jgi:VanZ family protein